MKAINEAYPVADHVKRLGPSSVPYELVSELVRLAELKQYEACGVSCCSGVCAAFQLTERIKQRIQEAGLWEEPPDES